MATFLVAHGAWSSAFAWRKMRPLMRAAGHELWTPSLTGLGERVHLATPDVDLSLHIEDILQVLFHEDLRDVHLIGHSYGGMVATGVADRAPERLAQVIYLDAFVPQSGESVFDLSGAGRQRAIEAAKAAGEGWRIPPNPLPPDTAADDVEWMLPRRHMQPIKAFEERLTLSGAGASLPRTYIYCTRPGPGDVFRQFADRFRSEPGWRYLELDASHNPHITMPEEFSRLLDRLAHT